MLDFIKAFLRYSLDIAGAWLGDNTAHFYGVLVSVPRDRT
jgi:hypothetical protein